MIYAIIVLGFIGLFFGIFLGFANKKLNIKINEKESLIIDSLPGANCGACGYPGCNACASAIFNKKTKINSCTIGGSDVANKIAKILNMKNETIEETKIFIHCNGSIKNSKLLYEYNNVSNCTLAKSMFNGQKKCNFSCLGYGNCVRACPFNAIKMNDGIPIINYTLCTNCKICIKTCPQNIIKSVPKKQHVFIKCTNTNKAKCVISSCNVGCIKCKKCEKICRFNAISVTNISKIDYNKCTNCKECIEVCPTKCIQYK